MSDFKGIMKGGWHPKGKDGGKESWRGDFKGINQVAGWVGKGKKADVDVAREHTSRPLTTLKDPSSFGPPPKNVNYHGGAALPNEITPHRGGLGAPLTQQEIQSAHAATHEMEEEQAEQNAKPPPPPLPYRADRTGLRTEHLPPPPVHRDIQSSTPAVTSPPTRQQPRAPPPLPSRQNTMPTVTDPPPPAYSPTPSSTSNSFSLNKSAVNRLGNAGVSVPALGIGNSDQSNPWKNERSQSNQSTGSQSANQMSELQSRFARMTSSSNATSTQAQSPSSPSQEQQNLPSFQQSQHAFQTAQNFQKNPSQVTVADAQAAAQTANQTRASVNNFRERHADSIANAQAKAKAWDQRYKVTSKINKFLDEHTDDDQQKQQGQTQANAQHQQPGPVSPQTQQTQIFPQTNTIQPPQPTPSPRHSSEVQASISRKPPPPPPPKKPASMQAPPPIPVGTKPR